MMATHELVVPKSMPITSPASADDCHLCWSILVAVLPSTDDDGAAGPRCRAVDLSEAADPAVRLRRKPS